MSARRRSARRVAALLVGLAVAPIVAELGYRLLRVDALGPTTNPRYVVHDERLGWRYRPLAREAHRTREFAVDVTIGAHGFRGEPWRLESPKSKPRVLVLGDSFAFGWGVGDAETFSAKLAALRPGWNVLNAGVSGYGTDQELLLLEELAPKVDPDVVVVVYCDNDRFENTLGEVYGKRKPRFVRVSGALELSGVPVEESWLEGASQLWRALEKADWERRFAKLERDPEEEWRLLADLYRAMKARLGAIPLVVVSGDPRVAQIAAELPGTTHVDLRAAFDGLAHERIAYADDGHWMPFGHEHVAAALAVAVDGVVSR